MKRIVLLLLCAQGIMHAASESSNSSVWLDDASKAFKPCCVFKTAALPSGTLTIETTPADMVQTYHTPKATSFAMETWGDSGATEEISHALGVTVTGKEAMALYAMSCASQLKTLIIESPTLAPQEVLNKAIEHLGHNFCGLVGIMGILIHADKCYKIYGWADESTPERSMPKLTISVGNIENSDSTGGGARPTIRWQPKEK